MTDWNIQSRSHTCQATEKPFTDNEAYHTLLFRTKEGYDRLEFTFPDLEGMPVSLKDEKYQDKVVLVSLAGTWCPNCGDETEFLSAYFEENSTRGL